MRTYNVYYETIDKLGRYIDKKNISNVDTVLVQIFSGVIDDKLLTKISKYILAKLPNAYIIGATTSGEIYNDCVTDNEIVISISIFEKSTISLYAVDNNEYNDSFAVGEELANSLYCSDSKVFIIFASGLTINGDNFLKGVNSIARGVTIAGGLSGDNAKFERTFVVYGDKILDNGVVGVSINSKTLIVHNDYSLAWRSIGKSFTVDKAKDNILYSIDGITPRELYQKYLGIDVVGLFPTSSIGIEFPLIIQKQNNHNICRAILSVQDDGSFVLVGNINEGDQVKFAVGDIELLVNGSHNVAKRCAKQNSEAIFIYSCMARKVYLESKSYLDIQDFSQITNAAGFFTYGEFYSDKKETSLLNQTLTVLSLSEQELGSKDINILPDKDFTNSISRKNALSHLINKTSLELEELNSQLENKIFIKTKELQELNENLEKKIKDAVEHNRQNEIQLLEQAKKVSLGDMIGNIAHQWRQPLTIISTASTGLLFKVDNKYNVTQEEYVEMLTKINDTTQFLSETINTFRDFVKEKKELKRVILQDRINVILEIIGASLKNNYIKFNINMGDEPIEIVTIAGEIDQVLINIIINARDILLERNVQSPWVLLDIIEEEKDVIITIEDNAGGIEENILDKIFEPYFTTRHQYQGTGLGLHMSRKIIEDSLNGRLYVKNTSRGAKFFIKVSKSDSFNVE